MAEVNCVRCGSSAVGMDHPPFSGPVGARVRDQVCAACWREWLGMQVKVINEYRLSPADPKHFDFLLAQMKAFLNLRDE